MQVASELDTSNGTEDGRSVNNDGGNNILMNNRTDPPRPHSPQFSHAYATLHPQPHNNGRSYDQLNILGQDTLAVHL